MATLQQHGVTRKTGKKPLVENEIVPGPPLDYSFLNLKNIVDTLKEEPVRGKRKHAKAQPSSPSGEQTTDKPTVAKKGGGASAPSAAQLAPPAPEIRKSPSPQKRVQTITTGLRVSNNQIDDISELPNVVNELLDYPEELAFLDLSFNSLTKIDDVITQYPKLSVLYLHQNRIADIHEVSKLAKLTNLRALTLNGNPMEEKLRDGYRMSVIAQVPFLKTLDFGPVTGTERQRAQMIADRQAKQAQKKSVQKQ